MSVSHALDNQILVDVPDTRENATLDAGGLKQVKLEDACGNLAAQSVVWLEILTTSKKINLKKIKSSLIYQQVAEAKEDDLDVALGANFQQLFGALGGRGAIKRLQKNKNIYNKTGMFGAFVQRASGGAHDRSTAG